MRLLSHVFSFSSIFLSWSKVKENFVLVLIFADHFNSGRILYAKEKAGFSLPLMYYIVTLKHTYRILNSCEGRKVLYIKVVAVNENSSPLRKEAERKYWISRFINKKWKQLKGKGQQHIHKKE